MQQQSQCFEGRTDGLSSHAYIAEVGGEIILSEGNLIVSICLLRSWVRDELELADIAMHGRLCPLRLLLMIAVIFDLDMLGFMESKGDEIISALEVGQVDEASEDVDGVLIEIGSEVGPRTEVGTVLNK